MLETRIYCNSAARLKIVSDIINHSALLVENSRCWKEIVLFFWCWEKTAFVKIILICNVVKTHFAIFLCCCVENIYDPNPINNWFRVRSKCPRGILENTLFREALYLEEKQNNKHSRFRSSLITAPCWTPAAALSTRNMLKLLTFL